MLNDIVDKLDADQLGVIIVVLAIVVAWMIVNVAQALRGTEKRTRSSDGVYIEPPSHGATPEVWKAYYDACATAAQAKQQQRETVNHVTFRDDAKTKTST